ncbi:MAG: Uma2 family endonuclease [Pirellula sp.]
MSIIVEPSTEMQLGPGAAGVRLSADEFDHALFEPSWRYELIHGVLVVSPATLPQERGPNQLLGAWLLNYKEKDEHGQLLDDTLPEHDIHVGTQRRRADRVIWAGLGRQPRVDETPTIAVEFVSEGKKNVLRDYQEKRYEYRDCGIQEYWIINRFERTMTVCKLDGTEFVVREEDTYCTPVLPGFELPLSKLLAAADRWNLV